MAIDRRQTPERRGGERVTYTEHLRVRKPAPQHGTAADVSSTGISIVVPQTIAEGTPIELELFGGTVFVAGKVSKVGPGIRGFRIGVRFDQEQPAILERAKGTRR